LWLLAATTLPSTSNAQQGAPDDRTAPLYRTPSADLATLADAPLTPAVSVGPNAQMMVLMEVPGLLTIEDVSQPELRLAGLRINPRTNGPSRDRYFAALTLERLGDGRQMPVSGLPDAPRIGSVRWSPDGSRIGFALTRENGIELWAADVATGEARALTDARLTVLPRSGAFEWLPDSRTLVTRLVPSDRGAPPPPVDIPSGPVIQENVGRVAPARTYQDLLTGPHDEALFEHYLTAQVALISLDGTTREVGPEGLIAGAEPSPDGQFLLVSTIHRPFSYLVPASRFPIRTEVWDLEGQVVATIADLPLAEEVPVGFSAVRTGRRTISWRADAPATLYWVEARDGGDPWIDAEVRDQIFTLEAPFGGEPVPLASLGLRYAAVQWGSDDLALVSSVWFRTRMVRAWVVQPGNPGTEPRLLFERSLEDRYSDPGRPLMRSTAAGTSVLLSADGGRTLFLVGQGASPEGNRPFLDRFDVASGATERLWRSEAPYYETPVELLDVDAGLVLTRREAVDEPPNYFVRDLAADGLRQLTDFPHPTPQLAGVEKELIVYEREDGVQLSATLYLPPGYEPDDGPLATLMWAYPREFKNADLAGQLTDSPYRFARVSYWGALPMLTQGWAVLDNPTLPIIGEGDEEPNDTYVEQLVAGAQAAVDQVVGRGVTDPERIAIGGHSYGAFMSANLLAHSDLFRAGIARSGAYNRTLTPFGFQLEERTFWEAPEIYFSMSPFMHADQVDEPLLMIHGDADNNSGTFPLQSRRFYHALKGHGATVRLVMLPNESHGYRARESILHMLWEEYEWLKRHVEDVSARPTATVSEAGE
jgi:dipeptidyl aminopeptidase/acylaminoacyl peptidase